MARYRDAPTTEEVREIQRKQRRQKALEALDDWRPKTRGDCAEVPRPCPYFGCRYNTAIDLTPQGSIRWRLPNPYTDEPDALEVENCALDVADRGPQNLEQIGVVMGVSRERIRQEVDAILIKVGPLMATHVDYDVAED